MSRAHTHSRAHSRSFPSLHLRHSSFSNPSLASPTSQFILQPFPRFTYVTGFSLTSSGGPPMVGSSLRPAADQSSKAAFGKIAFAKTCFLLLKIRLAHINRAKSKNAFENVVALLAGSILLAARAKTCSKVLLLFARLVCASHIFSKRKHDRARCSKIAFTKSSFARLVCA